jgi:hypothetical protein
MAAAGTKPGPLNRYAECGTFCRIMRHQTTGDLTLIGNFCRSRWCVACAIARARVVRQNLTQFVRRKRLRFLTLTLRHHGDEALSFLIDRFWKSFKLLRDRVHWRQHVSGFAMFVEVKWSERDSGWHVHGHCLCEGTYWDQKEISHLWHAATGDSYIVDIQAKGTPEQMAHYGSKYVTKPINVADVVRSDRLIEAIQSVSRRHLYLVGGSWKGKLKLDAKPPMSAEWEDAGDANTLWGDAANGDEDARLLISYLTKQAGTDRTPFERPPP